MRTDGRDVSATRHGAENHVAVNRLWSDLQAVRGRSEWYGRQRSRAPMFGSDRQADQKSQRTRNVCAMVVTSVVKFGSTTTVIASSSRVASTLTPNAASVAL